VAFDDPPNAGQADSGTRKLGIRMKPLERLEQLAHIGRIEAGPLSRT